MGEPSIATNLLVHGSNLILLLAYTTRNMLWLRVLALAAAVLILPYYVLQPEILWPPILWSVVYAGVHSYHVMALVLDRRSVGMTPDERRLHELSFPSLEPREFLRLLRLGRWDEASAGSRFESGGDEVVLLLSGRVDARRGEETIGEIREGEMVGVLFLLGEDLPGLELRAASAVRYVRWPLERMKQEMEHSPNVRAACTSLVNHDLASKLIRMVVGTTDPGAHLDALRAGGEGRTDRR